MSSFSESNLRRCSSTVLKDAKRYDDRMKEIQNGEEEPIFFHCFVLRHLPSDSLFCMGKLGYAMPRLLYFLGLLLLLLLLGGIGMHLSKLSTLPPSELGTSETLPFQCTPLLSGSIFYMEFSPVREFSNERGT